MEKLREIDLSKEPLIGRIIENPRAAILLAVIIAISSFDSCMQQISRAPQFPHGLTDRLDYQYDGLPSEEFRPMDFLTQFLDDGRSRSITNVIFDQRRETLQQAQIIR